MQDFPSPKKNHTDGLSRRNFLKGVTAAGALGALGNRPAVAMPIMTGDDNEDLRRTFGQVCSENFKRPTSKEKLAEELKSLKIEIDPSKINLPTSDDEHRLRKIAVLAYAADLAHNDIEYGGREAGIKKIREFALGGHSEALDPYGEKIQRGLSYLNNIPYTPSDKFIMTPEMSRFLDASKDYVSGTSGAIVGAIVGSAAGVPGAVFSSLVGTAAGNAANAGIDKLQENYAPQTYEAGVLLKSIDSEMTSHAFASLSQQYHKGELDFLGKMFGVDLAADLEKHVNNLPPGVKEYVDEAIQKNGKLTKDAVEGIAKAVSGDLSNKVGQLNEEIKKERQAIEEVRKENANKEKAQKEAEEARIKQIRLQGEINGGAHLANFLAQRFLRPEVANTVNKVTSAALGVLNLQAAISAGTMGPIGIASIGLSMMQSLLGPKEEPVDVQMMRQLGESINQFREEMRARLEVIDKKLDYLIDMHRQSLEMLDDLYQMTKSGIKEIHLKLGVLEEKINDINAKLEGEHRKRKDRDYMESVDRLKGAFNDPDGWVTRDTLNSVVEPAMATIYRYGSEEGVSGSHYEQDITQQNMRVSNPTDLKGVLERGLRSGKPSAEQDSLGGVADGVGLIRPIYEAAKEGAYVAARAAKEAANSANDKTKKEKFKKVALEKTEIAASINKLLIDPKNPEEGQDYPLKEPPHPQDLSRAMLLYADVIANKFPRFSNDTPAQKDIVSNAEKLQTKMKETMTTLVAATSAENIRKVADGYAEDMAEVYKEYLKLEYHKFVKEYESKKHIKLNISPPADENKGLVLYNDDALFKAQNAEYRKEGDLESPGAPRGFNDSVYKMYNHPGYDGYFSNTEKTATDGKSYFKTSVGQSVLDNAQKIGLITISEPKMVPLTSKDFTPTHNKYSEEETHDRSISGDRYKYLITFNEGRFKGKSLEITSTEFVSKVTISRPIKIKNRKGEVVADDIDKKDSTDSIARVLSLGAASESLEKGSPSIIDVNGNPVYLHNTQEFLGLLEEELVSQHARLKEDFLKKAMADFTAKNLADTLADELKNSRSVELKQHYTELANKVNKLEAKGLQLRYLAGLRHWLDTGDSKTASKIAKSGQPLTIPMIDDFSKLGGRRIQALIPGLGPINTPIYTPSILFRTPKVLDNDPKEKEDKSAYTMVDKMLAENPEKIKELVEAQIKASFPEERVNPKTGEKEPLKRIINIPEVVMAELALSGALEIARKRAFKAQSEEHGGNTKWVVGGPVAAAAAVAGTAVRHIRSSYRAK